MALTEYNRKVICDALSIDKTVISRMLTVVDILPRELALAIGPAPSIVRDRWLAMTKRAAMADLNAAVRTAKAPSSDARFEQILSSLTPCGTKPNGSARSGQKAATYWDRQSQQLRK